MKKLLNTLYVTSPDAYLSLDGENVVVLKEEERLLRMPLHNLEGIVSFGYTGASPALMAACSERNIALTFLTKNGKFLARVVGEVHGNVILRKTQYRISENDTDSLQIAKNMVIGKVYNSRSVLERAIRDYPQRVDVDKLKRTSKILFNTIELIRECNSKEELRGLEGAAANRYFGVLDDT